MITEAKRSQFSSVKTLILIAIFLSSDRLVVKRCMKKQGEGKVLNFHQGGFQYSSLISNVAWRTGLSGINQHVHLQLKENLYSKDLPLS